MRAMVMGAAAAVMLASGASAATTFEADVALDRLVGYLDGEDPQDSFSIIDDVSLTLTGNPPSVDVTGDRYSRSWTYAFAGSMALMFQGALLQFTGQISGDLDVYIYGDRTDDYEPPAEALYVTRFNGVAADGTKASLRVTGQNYGPPDDAVGFGFSATEAEALFAGLDSGSFLFEKPLGVDPLLNLILDGPDVTFVSEPTPFVFGSPYRLEVTSDSAPSPVPLPAGVTLLGAALAGLGLMRRRGVEGL